MYLIQISHQDSSSGTADLLYNAVYAIRLCLY